MIIVLCLHSRNYETFCNKSTPASSITMCLLDIVLALTSSRIVLSLDLSFSIFLFFSVNILPSLV